MIEAKNWKWIAGRTLALTLGLACVLLGTAGISVAQSSKAAPTASKAAPAAQKPSLANPAAKGLSTGIKVHGHWVIEVKNPDGTVAAHRDFENSLVQPATLLANVLSRQAQLGYWSIVLAPSNGNTSPCSATGLACFIVENGESCNIAAVAAEDCFVTMQAPVASNGGTVTLAGSAPASFAGTIVTVATDVMECPIGPDSTLGCVENGGPGVAFTSASSTSTPPAFAPVTVAAGQTISATVTFSFQ